MKTEARSDAETVDGAINIQTFKFRFALYAFVLLFGLFWFAFCLFSLGFHLFCSSVCFHSLMQLAFKLNVQFEQSRVINFGLQLSKLEKYL